MTTPSAWWRRPLFMSDKPKSPWGGGGGDEGPRNPWTLPPGNRPRSGAKPTALDEFLRRARGSGGGSGGGGGGFGGLPGGTNARSLWLIGAALLIGLWVVFTSVHQIRPQQRGVITVFGRYAGTLAPGFGITAPAPIAGVKVIDVERVRTVNFPTNGGTENLVLTGDKNLVDLNYTVRWNVNNPQDYIFELAEPDETVAAVAEASMRAVMANETLDDAIGGGRNRIEARVQELMQQLLNQYKSGVSVQSVAVNKASAPGRVQDAFKDVSAASQEAQSAINQARGEAQRVLARAEGDARQFDLAYAQYKLAPEVTRRRMYYETLESVLGKANKTIVGAPGVTPYLPLPAVTRPPELPPANVTVQGVRR